MYPLVIIEWDDACNSGEWHTEQEVDEWIENHGFRCQNVGWLIRKTKDFVVLAARISESDGQFGLLEKLPRRMIRTIKDL